MAWHPLTRLLVVVGPIALAASYFLEPEDASVVPAAVRVSGAQAALPPAATAQARDPGPETLPPLSALTETVERPLFSASRRPPAAPEPPPVVEQAAAPPPQPDPPPPLTLQGVIMGGDKTVALLRRDDTGELVTLAPGDELSGWRVGQVEPARVVLEGPDGPTELPLYPPPPP